MIKRYIIFGCLGAAWLFMGLGKIVHAEALCDVASLELQLEGTHSVCTEIINNPNVPAVERAIAYYVRGANARRVGNYQSAFEDLSAGLELDEANSLLHQDIARIFWDYREYDKAYQHVYRALALSPNGYMENYRLAMFLDEVKAPEALSQLNRLVNLASTYVTGRFTRALILIEKRNFKAAEQDLILLDSVKESQLKRELITHPYYFWAPRPFAHVLISLRKDILLGLNKFDEAIKLTDKFVADNPSSALAFYVRGNLRMSLPNELRPVGEDNSMSDYKKAVELEPTFTGAWFALIEQEMIRYNYDKVVQAVDTVLQTNINPDDASNFLWLKATAERGLNNTAAAVDYAQTSVKSKISNKIFYNDSFIVNILQSAGYLDKNHPLDTYDSTIADAVAACMNDQFCK